MKILSLHIEGFGKFHDLDISFKDGLNVVYGKNEAGKSTLHTFIRGMLFGIEKQRGRAARNDVYSKYEPWKGSGDVYKRQSVTCMFSTPSVLSRRSPALRSPCAARGYVRIIRCV